MKQANLIIGSKEVLATLNRTAAARIKADGENCSHLMHEIGMTDEEGYGEQLQLASREVRCRCNPYANGHAGSSRQQNHL